MWWFSGLFTMIFGFIITLVMLASSLAVHTKHRNMLVRIFGIMAVVQLVLICAVVVFILSVEL